MLSPVHPSVRPSVRRVYHRKTVKVRIVKFSLYGRPITLVCVGKFHPEILRVPERGRQTRDGWVKSGFFFLSFSMNISKTVADTAKVTIND